MTLCRPAPRWLLFDVFGTLTDWRTGIADALAPFLEDHGRADLDPVGLAEAWRARYQPAMEEVRAGRRDFVKLDVLHRENLADMLSAHGFAVGTIAGAKLEQLTLAWHRLPAWDDVAAGLAVLRERYLLAPLSNGNVSLLVDLARTNGLEFDAILGAEITRRYKPDPASYRDTLAILDCEPAEAMLVAAHPSDLAAAASCGLQTAYLHRPQEWSRDPAAPMPRGAWDYSANTLTELAAKLSAS